jgi:hypothetical protein
MPALPAAIAVAKFAAELFVVMLTVAKANCADAMNSRKVKAAFKRHSRRKTPTFQNLQNSTKIHMPHTLNSR